MKMREWFYQLTQREQLYVLGAAVALSSYLLLVVIWQPLASKRDRLQVNNTEVAEQLALVKAMASELQALKSDGGAGSKRNMNQLINASTNELGIRPSRIQPNSRGETQIRFEDVEFNQLLRWLHRMEASDGVTVHEVAITQSDLGGVVKATIRLGQSG
jgi:general secretion pathway protein M